ncbi:MAG: hypothetical protein CL663_06660 [Bacteroidetes bacterium]|mgnify:CR=1 FL=1|nr:hypothetical protein [Bacteroidota bacterium]
MKKRIIIKSTLVLALMICTSQVFALGKPFRLGVKVGVPNVVSINAEVVTPLFGNRMGLMADFSDFSLTIDDVKTDFSYFEIAGNVYFFSKGRGPYVSFSYLNMKTDLTYDDIASDIDPNVSGGTATTQVKLDSFTLKVGAKLGGLFYFRPEIGYLFTTLPDNVEITVDFPNFPSETQTEEIPSALTGSFIFNLGFGFAF